MRVKIKRNKYNVGTDKRSIQKRTVDGILFDSIREADHYKGLLLARRAGDLVGFILQPSFRLAAGIRYRADTIELWRTDKEGTYELRIVDVKGVKTDKYKLKKKLFEEAMGIEITEV